MPAWRATDTGVRLRVRLTPRGGADRIDGLLALADGTEVLAARVRLAPEDGKANAALERLVAATLGVAASAVSVVAGHKSRVKEIVIAGDVGALTTRLCARFAAPR